MVYKNICSAFVKNEVQKTRWNNRVYIDRLRDIELFAQGTYCSTGAGYVKSILKGRYPRQWKAIWRELNPKEYYQDLKSERKEKEQEKRENKKMKEEEELTLQRDQIEWKKAGGKT